MKKTLLFALFVFTLTASQSFAATRTVTNCADSGAGSLRQAINESGPSDLIVFNITTVEAGFSTGEAYPGLVTSEAAGKSWFRIILNSSLPGIGNNNVWVQGSTQPLTESNNPAGPEVEVRMNGTNDIFTVAGKTGVTIEGLTINRRGGSDGGSAISMSNAQSCQILACYIGLSATGEGLSPNKNTIGISIYNLSSNNKIGNGTAGGRNIISGASSSGIYIQNTGTTNNQVLGNYIGLNSAGTAAIANVYGVNIQPGVSQNYIGNGTDGGRNIISGNTNYGIFITGSGTNSNEVLGNYIGTNALGNSKLMNSYGVYVTNGANLNKIGDGTPGGRNVISGNNNDGIHIECNSNVVLGNYIGTNAEGAGDLGNGSHGVYINGVSIYNRIGDGTVGGRNVISGNDSDGVRFANGANNNQVLGNYIGTTVSGEAALPNQCGIIISLDAPNNRIGDGTAGGRNLISGNGMQGILISNSDSNIVLGNYIGTNSNNSDSIKNNGSGIRLEGTAKYNRIGDGTSAGRNVISRNNGDGVEIVGANSNEVKGNYIGTSANGTAALGNASSGIDIYFAGKYNRIGGAASGEGNLISGNQYGVLFYGTNTNSNEVLGNYIGVTASGEAPLPNSQFGVYIDGSGGACRYNKIGNGIAGGRNIISGNTSVGIELTSGTNEVKGNYIGTNVSGTAKIANSFGIRMTGVISNKIGGGNAGEGNLISGNDNDGIKINASSSNEVLGNYIGTNASGINYIQNGNCGVLIMGGSKYNKVGNAIAGGRNVVNGNQADGVRITDSGTNSNEVLGNYIGLYADGSAGPPANGYGVGILSSASFNKIGNGTSNGRNILSNNSNANIYINAASINEVKGNYIGVNVAGNAAAPNNGYGVWLDGAKYNKFGDGTEGGRNIISGNSEGIRIMTNSDSNEVAGNCIGTDPTGTLNLGNTQGGIVIISGAFNRFGPSNLVAYNDSDNSEGGIKILNSGTTSETVTRNSIFSNYGKGIWLLDSNRGIRTPTIETSSYSQLTGLLQITGTATPNATVEIFKAQGNQGKTYLDYATANGAGAWNKSLTVMGLVSHDALTATQTDPLLDTSEFCATKEVNITAAFMYQPDLAAGKLFDGSDYKTIGEYENTPVNQVQSMSVATNEAAVFYFKMLNAGNTADTILVSGEGSGGDYTVKYLDGKTGTAEVAFPIVSVMASGESGEGRVEITYSGNAVSTKEIVITATTTNDTNRKDAIKMIAVFNPLVTPSPTPEPTTIPTKEFTETQLGIPGMHITIPSGATTIDAVVTATEVTQSPGAAPVGYMVGGKVINIQSNVTQFAIPVTVTMPITGPLAAPRVEHWDGTAWSTAGIVVVSYTNTSITFTTTHFTIFAPMGAAPGNLVRFGPNPYNPNNGSGSFWYWLDASKDTSIYLIDLGGTIVWKNSYSSGINGARLGENNISYDGKTSWGDVLGNGVYLYKIVQDSKSIGGGKIAVIK